MEKAKKTRLVIVIAIVIWILILPLAIWLGIKVHQFNNPQWMKEAEAVACKYLENNEELIKEYGLNFKYSTIRIRATKEKEAKVTFSIKYKEYVVAVEYQDSEWVAIGLVE